MYTWQKRKHYMDATAPIKDFMIPKGRLGKHINTFEHVYTGAPTHKYVRVQPNTNRAVICVFLHLIQQMLPLQRKFVDSNLWFCCHKQACVLCFHHPLRWGRWLAACTRSRKQKLLWHAVHNESMLCDVCVYEVNCGQFQPGQMRMEQMEHIFSGKSHLDKS